MTRPSPPLSNAEYTTYKFTASSEIDYNYDPSGSTTSATTPAFDPYTDTYPAPEDDWYRDERSPRPARRRSPSPLLTSPSPEYITESQKPSTRLNAPTDARKLLILDLNGTLVYRSPHVRRLFRRRHAHDNHDYRPTSPPDDPYADHTAPRPLRTAHPRPYMRAFREYLFHPSTRAWLDTMVWSSAQPHSVADMVDKCFGSQQDELLAIWARDTLGLEEYDYNRKVQTTKDLTRPWSKLRFPSSADSDTPQGHSAHTTLLLDDSPLKANLQPYNHLCIREYTGALRQLDLQSRQREQRAQQIANHHQAQDIDSEHAEYTDPNSTPPKKRKRPKKKHTSLDPESEALDDFTLDLGLGGYDSTLLAVIGVLERIKWEGNVAGWMRSGGLARAFDDEAFEYKHKDDEVKGDDEEDVTETEIEIEPLNTLHVLDPKRRRLSSPPPPPPMNGATIGDTGQWFEDRIALGLWVRRGVRTLEALGVGVDSGVAG